jgi:hypothetical protein
MFDFFRNASGEDLASRGQHNSSNGFPVTKALLAELLLAYLIIIVWPSRTRATRVATIFERDMEGVTMPT